MGAVNFKLPIKHYRFLLSIFIILAITSTGLIGLYFQRQQQKKIAFLESELSLTSELEIKTREQLTAIEKELNELKSQDQLKINAELKKEIKEMQKTYKNAVDSYEKILELRESGVKTGKLDGLFVMSLDLLSKRNYATASAKIKELDGKIEEEKIKLAAATNPPIPQNVPVANAPPDSGYRRQSVSTDMGTFMVDIISADLNNTRVIVDTASDGDCADNCPVLPLAEYVARNGAFAGVNGSYFCPAEYPSCASKKNSFDTLLMNKNKKYINSDNNVYSNVPAVIFSGSSARFVTRSLEWGRDTGVDAVIANHPLLVFNSQLFFTGGGDPKQISRGNRSFVGVKDSKVFIGVVHRVSVAESAKVLHTLGLTHALNLDNGGSTALWSAGYKVGPGRNLPNVVLFVRK